jgi:hypothetical protein
MRLVALGLLTLALVGCGRTVVEPRIVYVDRTVYVEVDPELTSPHPIAEGPLSHCPVVAAARKAELEACNADKAAVRKIEGGAVPEPVRIP